jgi:protoporphyrinogen oxidase
MEYFCSQGDNLWEMSNAALIDLATEEIMRLGLGVKPGDVEDGCVIRQFKAYPVYDGEYRHHLTVLEDYIRGFENLQTVGRNGMHRYNNQDHSMLSAMLAAKNIMGEHHDIWNINVERSYHENFTDYEWSQLKQGTATAQRSLQAL